LCVYKILNQYFKSNLTLACLTHNLFRPPGLKLFIIFSVSPVTTRAYKHFPFFPKNDQTRMIEPHIYLLISKQQTQTFL